MASDRGRYVIVYAKKTGLKQEDWICETCGSNQQNHGYKNSLSIHHIDFNHCNDEPNNLMCLCHGCHMRFHSTGRKGYRKGVKVTDETRLKMSASHIGIKHTEETKIKIGSASKGRKHTVETKLKMSKPHKIVECPHCKKKGGKPNMTRYHFDNCKFKER